MKASPRRRWVRVVAIAFGTIAGLGVLELVGRALPPLPLSASWTIPIRLLDEAELERDPDLLWRWPGRAAPEYDASAAVKVLCLADSVSVMFGGHGYPDLFEERLDERIVGGASVWNAGVPGYSSELVRRYLELYADAPAPHLATVQLAWNDHAPTIDGRLDADVRLPSSAVLDLHARLEPSGLYQLVRRAMGRGEPEPGTGLRVPPDDFERNLREIVGLLRARGSRVMLITSPYLDSSEDYVPVHTEYNRRTALVAREEGALLVDPVAALVDRPELWIDPTFDHVHFNGEGAELQVNLMVEALEASGWFDQVGLAGPRG